MAPPPPPPPPGPPPPPSSGAPKLSKNDEKSRGALLSDICKGSKLKSSSHLTVDKSKPVIGSEGGPVASNSTIGRAGGRSGGISGPPNLAGLFAGAGVPKPKAAASHDPPVQNGYRSNPAAPPRGPGVVRPPRPGAMGTAHGNPTSLPPPLPPSAATKPSFNNTERNNQENLTGRGANGRISGLGMGMLSPPLPISRPPPPARTSSNRAPPPPAPPSRSMENRPLPPPPPAPAQYAPPSSSIKAPPPHPPKTAPPPIPKSTPGAAPPPPPVRSNNPPIPPPPSRGPGNTRSQPLPAPSVPKKSTPSFESRFNFPMDLPTPPHFKRTPKSYPSASPRNDRPNNSANRPCPPPPPM